MKVGESGQSLFPGRRERSKRKKDCRVVQVQSGRRKSHRNTVHTAQSVELIQIEKLLSNPYLTASLTKLSRPLFFPFTKAWL